MSTPSYPSPWNEDDPTYWNETLKRWSFVRKYEVPQELQQPLWSGKLSQQCSHCGVIEPAGAYCSKCKRQTSPDDWYQNRSRNEDGTVKKGRAKQQGRTVNVPHS